MDGATIASLAGTAAAIVVALLAFVRGRLTDVRKANTADVTVAVTGLQTLAAEQRIEINALRAEVHTCEMDKAAMKARFEVEIAQLRVDMTALRRALRAVGGDDG